jgi:hypothetical protein
MGEITDHPFNYIVGGAVRKEAVSSFYYWDFSSRGGLRFQR